MVEAVTQGVCTECEQSDDNYMQLSRDHNMPDDEDERSHAEIERDLRCECGEDATVTITETGIETTGAISHEGATWNGDSDESPDE